MNCRNCGAPPVFIQQRRIIACEYCGAEEQVPCPLDEHDRVVVIGTQTDLSCPQCDVTLVQGTMDNQSVSCCQKCRGVWLKRPAFANLVWSRRAKYEGRESEFEPISPDQFERQLMCPECRVSLETHPFHGPGYVVIDSCIHCNGVWIDRGEMARIERAPGKRSIGIPVLDTVFARE